jgi:hypothetical protein
MPQAPTRGRVPPAQRGLVVPHDLPAPAQFGHHERGVAGRVPGRLPEHPAIPRIERHQRRRRPAGVDDQPALDEERGAGVAPLRNRRPEFPRQFPLPQRLPVPGRNAMQMPERAQQIRPAAVNQRSGPRRLPVIQIAHRRVIELPHQLAIGHPERQKHIPLVERIPIGHEHQTLGDREPRQTRPAQRLAPDPVGPARQPIRQPNRPTIPAPPTPVRPAVGSGLVPNRRGRRRRGSVRARTRSGRSRFGRGQIAGHPAVAGFELLQQVGVFADLAQRGLKGAGLRGRQGGRGETGDKGNRLRLGQNAQGARRNRPAAFQQRERVARDHPDRRWHDFAFHHPRGRLGATRASLHRFLAWNRNAGGLQRRQGRLVFLRRIRGTEKHPPPLHLGQRPDRVVLLHHEQAGLGGLPLPIAQTKPGRQHQRPVRGVVTHHRILPDDQAHRTRAREPVTLAQVVRKHGLDPHPGLRRQKSGEGPVIPLGVTTHTRARELLGQRIHHQHRHRRPARPASASPQEPGHHQGEHAEPSRQGPPPEGPAPRRRAGPGASPHGRRAGVPPAFDVERSDDAGKEISARARSESVAESRARETENAHSGRDGRAPVAIKPGTRHSRMHRAQPTPFVSSARRRHEWPSLPG